LNIEYWAGPEVVWSEAKKISVKINSSAFACERDHLQLGVRGPGRQPRAAHAALLEAADGAHGGDEQDGEEQKEGELGGVVHANAALRGGGGEVKDQHGPQPANDVEHERGPAEAKGHLHVEVSK